MVTLSNASQYGDGIWGFAIIVLVFGMLHQIMRYRATRDKRYVRSSAGIALVIAAVAANALSVHVLVCFGLLVPGAALMLANIRLPLPFGHDEQRTHETDAKCYNCGYDLRGTIAAGIDVCPECGERVK